jgi:hypothetical protein
MTKSLKNHFSVPNCSDFLKVIFVTKLGKIYNHREMVQKRIKIVGIGLIFDLSTQSRYREAQGVNFFSKKRPSKLLLNRTKMLDLAQCA